MKVSFINKNIINLGKCFFFFFQNASEILKFILFTFRLLQIDIRFPSPLPKVILTFYLYLNYLVKIKTEKCKINPKVSFYSKLPGMVESNFEQINAESNRQIFF